MKITLFRLGYISLWKNTWFSNNITDTKIISHRYLLVEVSGTHFLWLFMSQWNLSMFNWTLNTPHHFCGNSIWSKYWIYSLLYPLLFSVLKTEVILAHLRSNPTLADKMMVPKGWSFVFCKSTRHHQWQNLCPSSFDIVNKVSNKLKSFDIRWKLPFFVLVTFPSGKTLDFQTT